MKIYLKVRKGLLSKLSIEKGKVRMNSLFLMYNDSEMKQRHYEFLRLYVYDKPRNYLEKEHNKETMLLAESIRAQRVLEYQSRKHGFVSSVSGKVGFLEYFKQLVEKKQEVNGTYGSW